MADMSVTLSSAVYGKHISYFKRLSAVLMDQAISMIIRMTVSLGGLCTEVLETWMEFFISLLFKRFGFQLFVVHKRSYNVLC